MGRFNQLLSTLQQDDAEALTRSPSAASKEQRKSISRDRIVRDADQVRKYFDPKKLKTLAQTIAEEGILEDIAVYELADQPEYYQLIFGERRFRAAEIAGLSEVPVRVFEKPEPQRLLRLQLIENKHHEELNPIEEVEGVLELLSAELDKPTEAVIALLKQMDNDARRQSNNVIGQPAGETIIKTLEGLNIHWRSLVLNQLPLLSLSPKILKAIRQGKIEYTKALAISRLKDEQKGQELLQEAIEKNLSIRDIRERIKQLSHLKPANAQTPTYYKRITLISQRLKTKKDWDDRGKRDRLEQLLTEMEKLIGEN